MKEIDEGVNSTLTVFAYNIAVKFIDDIQNNSNECLSFTTNCGTLNLSLNSIHICG
jgi:hypothetical protein